MNPDPDPYQGSPKNKRIREHLESGTLVETNVGRQKSIISVTAGITITAGIIVTAGILVTAGITVTAKITSLSLSLLGKIS
jgi:hypothetical protein